jgi:hypothetical protein
VEFEGIRRSITPSVAPSRSIAKFAFSRTRAHPAAALDGERRFDMFRRFAILAGGFLAAAVVAGEGFAATLSGHVQTPEGTPVFDSNQSVFDPVTGTQITTTGDHTASNGNFAFTVPDGTFNVHVVPHIADHLAPVKLSNVVVAGDTNLGTIVVQHGFILSATLTDPSHAPVANGHIRVLRASDGFEMFTSGNRTLATGFVDVSVPAGVYNVDATPATGQLLAGLRIDEVSVTADTSLGSVVLPQGFTLTGQVVGPGAAPVAAANMDARDTFTGHLIPLLTEFADSLGNFSIIVPAGSVDVSAKPPATTLLTPVRVLDVAIPATTSLGTIAVAPGFAWTGTVTFGGVPVYRANLRAYDHTDDNVPIDGHRTDTNGAILSEIPGGSDDLVVENDISLSLKRVILENVNVTGPRNDTVVLGSTPATVNVTTTTIGVLRGNSIEYTLELRNDTASPQTVDYFVTGSAFGGAVRRTLHPLTTVTLPAGPGITVVGPLSNRVPPSLRPRFTRVPVRVGVRVTDHATSNELDFDFFTFRVY